MTLEDFFTLSELKDGLTTPARVSDLLTVMQTEKNNVVENVNEAATKHWLAVATTIASTENKECLDLFVQLDGLWFFDRWLQAAQIDTGNDYSEDLIIKLLAAVERLEVEKDRAVRSGIGRTVEGLFGHSSSLVREKAKVLCDRWTPIPEIEPDRMESHSVAISEENVEPEPEPEKETEKEEIPEHEMTTESQNPVDLVVVGGDITETVDVGGNLAETHLTEVSGSTPPAADGGGGGGGDEEQLDVSEIDKDVEDANEKQEIAGAVESSNLSSPLKHETDLDNGLETGTNTEMRDSDSDKDEDMMDGGGGESPENPDKTTSNTESDEEDGKKDDDSGSDSSFSKRSTKGQDLVNKRPSDMELDYGIVDPLELARQVAIEVEQEVDSCSTSQNMSEIDRPNSPESENEKEHQSSPGSIKEELVQKTENSIAPVQESEPNAEKGFSGFDLNQEVSSEEVGIEYQNPVSTPIAVVSASRPEPAEGLPVTPLQFEGTLGWKGSAATSAFRRIPEVEKTISSSSQRSDRLDFDLNIAESGDDKIEDKTPITSYLLPSRVELPRKLDRLELDLNSFGDGDSGNIPLEWNRDSRVTKFTNIPSSSSSIQPPFTNIDLNLNNLNNHSNINPNNAFLSKLFNKREESVISIFGTQVEVNRHNPIPNNYTSIPQPNGIDFTLGRPGSGSGSGSGSMAYTNLPSYPHNGFTMGGPMYGPPGGSAWGGSVPYMMGSTSSVPPVYSQPVQPFMFMGGPSGSNGAGPSRQSFDLNSGNFMGDLGNRENNGGLRQFFNNTRPVDEQFLRMNNNNSFQGSSSSVIGGKRQEPDGGWELFPVNYKHHHHNSHHHQQQPPPPWQ